MSNQGYNRLPNQDGDEVGDKDDPAPPYTANAPGHASGSQAPPPPQPQLGPYYDDPNRAGQPWVQGQQLVNVVPGPQAMVLEVQRPPTDWTIPAILACLFCFWPTGIFAIVFANKANTAYGQYDYAGAKSSAHSAKVLTLTSIGIGVAITVTAIILIAVIVTKAEEIAGDFVNSINDLTTTRFPASLRCVGGSTCL